MITAGPVGRTVAVAAGVSLVVAVSITNRRHAPDIAATVNGCTLRLDVADTPGRRATGLSGTSALPGDGLLLRWPRPGLHAIWMAGISYPLDLAWLDREGVVQAVPHDVPPCAGTPCRIYAPPGAASSVAVLETAAGRLAACGVRPGQALLLAATGGHR